MDGAGRGVTLADVADVAGVHVATVSRAVSRPELVGATTLARVERAIDELGYVPNRAARQLAGGPSASVAVLVPDITNPFFSAIVQAAQRTAASSSTLVLLADTAQNPTTELEALNSLAPNVDGVVLCSPVAAPRQILGVLGDRPVVFVNRRARGIASVVVDQGAIVTLAVDHLTSLGHRRIVVVDGPTGYWSSTQRLRRLAAIDGRGSVEIVRVGPTEPTFDGGTSVFDEVVARDATAVVAFNDVMALGLLSAAVERGIAVPHDLSIVGVDGVDLAHMSTPGLTTVAVDLDHVGREAVESIEALVRDRSAVTVRSISPTVIVRGSTGPIPSRGPGAGSR